MQSAQPQKVVLPELNFNPDGWGPKVTTDKFKDIPYQPFSKADRIGKIADWMGLLYQDKKYTNKYTSQYGTGTQYAYFHEEEESGFQIVDTTKIPKPAYQKLPRYRYNQQRNFKQFGKNQRGGGGQQRNRQNVQTSQQSNSRQMNQSQYQQQKYMRGQRFFRFATKSAVPVKIHRESSVRIKPDWKVIEELDFQDLNKMSLPNMDKPVDLKSCGAVEYYDKQYDRCNTKNAKALVRINRIYPQATTTDDAIIRELAKTEGNVYFTDTILATLMCTTKSIYSWDIIAEKIKGKIFFDKRDTPEVDLLTVSETALDPPIEDPENMNSIKNLSMEATYINHNFSQQVLKGEEKYIANNPNPFEVTNEDGEIAPKLYKYRKWDLGNNVMLVCRTELDAVQFAAENNDMQFLNVKCLNEWDSRHSNGIDWRSKIDTQKTAIFANELKNNACKLSKWTASSILSGADFFKLGFVSRLHPNDSSKHVIISVQQFRPSDLAQNINLHLVNGWGIVRYLIDRIFQLPDGKFVIMKDPNKQCLRLYSVPLDAFSSTEESSSSEHDPEDEDEDAAGPDLDENGREENDSSRQTRQISTPSGTRKPTPDISGRNKTFSENE